VGYPRKLLNPGERVAVDVGPHWKYMVRPGVVVVLALALSVEALGAETDRWEQLALAAVLVLCLLWLGTRYLRWATTSFTVTNERLILRKGVLRRSWREILLDRLTDISCRQTLGDRLLGCGDIVLESPGRDGQEVFPGLPHPLRIQKEIYRLINERRLAVPTGGGAPGANAGGAGAASKSGGASGGRAARGAGAVGAPPPTAFSATAASSAADSGTRTVVEATLAEQLSQLNDLRRRGVISRREYAAKKAELLARM
jgi:membrane protein YdbS with pleckstrin-like domain